MENFMPGGAQDYLDILFKRKKLFIRPFLLVLVLVAVAYPFLPRVYRAAVLLQVEDDKIISPLIQGLAMKANVEKKEKTIAAQVLSWTNLGEIAKRTGLSSQNEDPEKLETLLKFIKDHISIKTVSDKVIQINYENKNPELAYKVANAIGENLLNKNTAGQQEEAQSAIQFIDEQLHVYKDRLQGSEKTFFINKVNTDLNESIKKRALLADQISRMDKVIITEVVKAQNPQVIEMRKDLLQAESLLAQMEAQGQSNSNPLMGELRVKVESLRKRVRFQEESQSGSETSSTNPVYQDLMRQLKELDLNISSLQKRKSDMEEGRIVSNRVSEQTLLSMERDKRVNEDIYQSLLMRLENAHISQRLDELGLNKTFTIIDPARMPVRPSKPDPIRILGLGLALAIGSGLFVIFVAEYLDKSFRGPADAKVALALPLLASFQRGDFGRRSGALVAHDNPESIASEQFRMLRTKIFYQNGSTPYKTLLFTSALRAEGVSVSVANTAISLAQETGQRILLVDCDIREGSVSKLLSAQPEKQRGLAEYLSGNDGIDGYFQLTKVDRLTILPAGAPTSNPFRLLSSDKMKHLMNDLRGRFDLILIDAPPVLNYSDVPVLLNFADAVVLVVKSGQTSRELVSETIEIVQEFKKALPLGYVLTDVADHLPAFLKRVVENTEKPNLAAKGVVSEKV